MTRGDAIVEKGANRLQRLANKAAAEGGLRARLGQELAEDAAFVRKLKPSLMAARARGEAPTNQSSPRLRKRARRRAGPSPFVVVLIALGAGIALAKLVDWRSHAHQRG